MVVLLLLSRAPRLLAGGANNLAVRALVAEWDVVRQEAGVPQCRKWLAKSAARRALTLALRGDPAHERALLNRGRAAWLAGECAEAEVSWERALVAAPGDRMAAFWLFWAWGADACCLPAGFPGEEVARYAYWAARRAKALDRGAAVSWYELSLALALGLGAAGELVGLYRQIGGREEVVAAWQRLAAVWSPQDPEHWWALGQAAELEKAWERAAWAYGRGGEIAPEPYEFWMRQARAFARLWRPREQEGAYHRAITACPSCLAPYLDLGRLWQRQGQHEGALGWYKEAGRVAPRDPRPLYYQAQVSYEMGDAVRAVETLGRAIALHQGRPWRWAVQLGDWRLELGDREGALAAYRQALGWNPGEAAIQERIQQETR